MANEIPTLKEILKHVKYYCQICFKPLSLNQPTTGLGFNGPNPALGSFTDFRGYAHGECADLHYGITTLITNYSLPKPPQPGIRELAKSTRIPFLFSIDQQEIHYENF
jgi:hypothetical protein